MLKMVLMVLQHYCPVCHINIVSADPCNGALKAQGALKFGTNPYDNLCNFLKYQSLTTAFAYVFHVLRTFAKTDIYYIT